jgi:hypothetical protein
MDCRNCLLNHNGFFFISAGHSKPSSISLNTYIGIERQKINLINWGGSAGKTFHKHQQLTVTESLQTSYRIIQTTENAVTESSAGKEHALFRKCMHNDSLKTQAH